MENIIKEGDIFYAQYCPLSTLTDKNKTEWYGENHQYLQLSRMYYDKTEFKNHKHILNPRVINRTQEAFIVIKGKIKITIYNNSKKRLGDLIASSGEAIIVFNGFHKLKFIEDETIAYEVKAGQFTSVSDDKELFC